MHKHHIMPRSIGGTNDPENLVEVTVEEHAKIHHSQWILGGRWQDYIAWRGLSNSIETEELIRVKQRLVHLGKPKSEEHKRKLSEAKRGRTLTEEHKKKIGLSLKGKPQSEQKRMKCRASKLGDQNPAKRPEVRKKMSETHKRMPAPSGCWKKGNVPWNKREVN